MREGIIHFKPFHTTERFQMDQYKEDLIQDMEHTNGRVKVLFDMRDCSPGFCHVEYTIRVLVENEEYMKRKLEVSVALFRYTRLTKLLCDAFMAVYTPVRPFYICTDEKEALEILLATKSHEAHFDRCLRRL